MKFRVWDKGIGIFLDEGWDFFIDQFGILWFMRLGVMAKASSNLKPVFSAKTQDKRGVELFDGDIIDLCQKEFTGEHHIKEILFAGGAWRTRSKLEKSENEHHELLRLLCDAVSLSYVKIGNRFENPELLERT